MKTVVAVWGIYPRDEAGETPAILSMHSTQTGADKWADEHHLQDWWTYTYEVKP